MKDLRHLSKDVTPGNEDYPNQVFINEICTLLLEKESQYRLSFHYQNLYKNEIAKDPNFGYQTVTDQIQRQLAEDLNINPTLCAKILQHSSQLIAHADEISFYRKYNRLVDGALNIGDDAPQVLLHDFDNNLMLVNLLSVNHKPQVLIAGSYS